MAEEPIKVGMISCAGEDVSEGTISRLAVRRAMAQLRPGRAVSICLPFFLAGVQGEREFALNLPTITIDGSTSAARSGARRSTEVRSTPPSW
jgi:hypothetical protein